MSSNVTGYTKIISHPDKDELVEKLIAGVPVRQIEAWLRSKYAKNKKLQVSFVSLQSFRKNYLNIEAEALKELQKERRQLQVIKKQEQDQERVQKIQTYQAGLANYVQSSLIDYNAEMLGLIDECKDGIRHLKDLNINKGLHLNHVAIAAYIGRLQDVIQMHNKMVTDQEKRQGNKLEEDYEQLNKKMEILIEAVREAFSQTNPEGLFTFVQLVKTKMEAAGLTN